MGVKISALPAIAAPALGDVFPVVQGGVTYKETFTQLSSLFATAGANSNITSLTGLTTPLSVAQGGTGTTTSTGTGSVVLNNNPNLIGTATNDNAAAGSIGEYISSTVLTGAAVAATTATPLNVTSISLTAGDWNVSGNVHTNAAGGTTTSALIGGINTVSATIPTVPGGWFVLQGVSVGAGQSIAGSTGTIRVSLAATTTIYLVAQVEFAVSTLGVYGFIGARRAR